MKRWHAKLNQYEARLDIRGLILQADEAVLVENRLNKKIPIVDEVRHIDKVPEDETGSNRGCTSGYEYPDAFQSIWNRYTSGTGRR